MSEPPFAIPNALTIISGNSRTHRPQKTYVLPKFITNTTQPRLIHLQQPSAHPPKCISFMSFLPKAYIIQNIFIKTPHNLHSTTTPKTKNIRNNNPSTNQQKQQIAPPKITTTKNLFKSLFLLSPFTFFLSLPNQANKKTTGRPPGRRELERQELRRTQDATNAAVLVERCDAEDLATFFGLPWDRHEYAKTPQDVQKGFGGRGWGVMNGVLVVLIRDHPQRYLVFRICQLWRFSGRLCCGCLRPSLAQAGRPAWSRSSSHDLWATNWLESLMDCDRIRPIWVCLGSENPLWRWLKKGEFHFKQNPSW